MLALNHWHQFAQTQARSQTLGRLMNQTQEGKTGAGSEEEGPEVFPQS